MSESQQEDEYELDLFWNALNYRTAASGDAEAMWQELVACVGRLVKQEREACARLCETGVDTPHPTVPGNIMKLFGRSQAVADAIRNRSTL